MTHKSLVNTHRANGHNMSITINSRSFTFEIISGDLYIKAGRIELAWNRMNGFTWG